MNNNDYDLLEKLVLDTHSKMSIIMSDMSAIKVDLAEHIKRTHQNEIKIDFVQRHVYYVQGAIAFIGLMATALGIWKLF